MFQEFSIWPRILLYGTNLEVLQQYASALLGSDLRSVDFAVTEYNFERHLGRAQSPYDLIILCSTIPSDEQTRIRNSEFSYSGTPVYSIPPNLNSKELQDDLGAWLNFPGHSGSLVERTEADKELSEKWFGQHSRFAFASLLKRLGST